MKVGVGGVEVKWLVGAFWFVSLLKNPPPPTPPLKKKWIMRANASMGLAVPAVDSPHRPLRRRSALAPLISLFSRNRRQLKAGRVNVEEGDEYGTLVPKSPPRPLVGFLGLLSLHPFSFFPAVPHWWLGGFLKMRGPSFSRLLNFRDLWPRRETFFRCMFFLFFFFFGPPARPDRANSR